MAQLTVQVQNHTSPLDFTATAVAAAGGGDKFTNTGAQMVLFNNGSGAPITITMVIQATLDGQTAANRTYAIAAGHAAILGPFPPQIYNDGSGNMNFTYSGVTTLTVMPFQMGQ